MSHPLFSNDYRKSVVRKSVVTTKHPRNPEQKTGLVEFGRV